MSDVFISYSRSDRAQIERLSAALEASGCSVWWDRDISGGSRFAGEIETRLAEAKAVIVAWSRNSVTSMWVLDEASSARDAGKLVPISLDGAAAPIGFRQLHVLDFEKWRGEREAPEIDALVSAISKIGRTPLIETSKPRPRVLWRRRAGVIGAAAAAFIALGAGWFIATRPPPQASNESADEAARTYDSIAVLPFVDASPAKDQGYLADGIAGEILNVLARNTALRVVARTSSFAFKDKSLSIAEIGKALDAEAILEGTLTRVGDRLKVSLQLVDAKNGFTLLSDSFEKPMTGVFEIQDEIAAATAKRLNVALAPSASRPTGSVEAYEAYLKGKGLVDVYGKDAHKAAKAEFERAVALDPKFADAYAYLTRLSIWLSVKRHGDMPDDIAVSDAKRFLDQATALAPDAPLTIVARIHYLGVGVQDTEGAFREAERGAKLYPNTAEIVSYYGLWLGRRGEVDQFAAVAARAVELDPMSREAAQNYLGSLTRAGRRADLLRAANDALSRFPDSVVLAQSVAASLAVFGDSVGALEARLQAFQIAPDDKQAREGVAWTLYQWGFTEEAEPFITDELTRLRLMAMDLNRLDDVREYVKRFKGDVPPDVQAEIAYVTGYDSAQIPEMEKEAEEQTRFEPMSFSPNLALAYKYADETQKLSAYLAECEKRISAAVSKGANSPRFWWDAALVAGAADNAALVVNRLDRALAFHDASPEAEGSMFIDPAFAGVKDDPRIRALATRIDAEYERQRKEVIDSGVLKRIADAAAAAH